MGLIMRVEVFPNTVSITVPVALVTPKIKAALTAAAGGYTEVPAKGGWVDSTGLVFEDVNVIISAACKDDPSEYAAHVAILAEVRRLHNAGEQAVMTTRNGQTYIYHK